MKQVRMVEVLERLRFVTTAKRAFNANPKLYSFGDLEPGNLFAMRFGLMDDCMVVFRIYPECDIDNYVGIIDRREEAS